jgi:N-acetylglucosamine kinase-like BadF-type ATPase
VPIAGTDRSLTADTRARTARAGGWGYVLGDEGSGYWLGRNALRAVVRAADGRGQSTTLTAHVLAHYGAARPQELVRAIAGLGARPSAIARLASAVGAAAAEGDAVAGHMIAAAAQELAVAAESCAAPRPSRRAALLAGGTLRGVESLRPPHSPSWRRLPQMPAALLTAEPAPERMACVRCAGWAAELPTPIDRRRHRSNRQTRQELAQARLEVLAGASRIESSAF